MKAMSFVPSLNKDSVVLLLHPTKDKIQASLNGKTFFKNGQIQSPSLLRHIYTTHGGKPNSKYD